MTASVKHYSSKRTKTACISNGTIALKNELVSKLKQVPFSMAMEGSNDTDLEKMNPLTNFDINRSKVVTGFLGME